MSPVVDLVVGAPQPWHANEEKFSVSGFLYLCLSTRGECRNKSGTWNVVVVVVKWRIRRSEKKIQQFPVKERKKCVTSSSPSHPSSLSDLPR